VVSITTPRGSHCPLRLEERRFGAGRRSAVPATPSNNVIRSAPQRNCPVPINQRTSSVHSQRPDQHSPISFQASNEHSETRHQQAPNKGPATINVRRYPGSSRFPAMPSCGANWPLPGRGQEISISNATAVGANPHPTPRPFSRTHPLRSGHPAGHLVITTPVDALPISHTQFVTTRPPPVHTTHQPLNNHSRVPADCRQRKQKEQCAELHPERISARSRLHAHTSSGFPSRGASESALIAAAAAHHPFRMVSAAPTPPPSARLNRPLHLHRVPNLGHNTDPGGHGKALAPRTSR